MSMERMAAGLRELPRAARVESVGYEAPHIRSLRLVPADHAAWPAAKAGAHIDLELPNGLVRQYSIVNPDEENCYRIAVLRAPQSKGGSTYIFDCLHEGAELSIRGPRNNFPLKESPRSVCLIAGGIGVTPLLSMAQVLTRSGRTWRLYYCVRDRASIGFADILEHLEQNISFHIDAEMGAAPCMEEIIRSEPDSDYYCCGPAPMLAAFRVATATLPPDRVHLESFGPASNDRVPNKAFTVELARSGLRLMVPPEKTIIAVLQEAGIPVLYSCLNGMCGTCETTVLEGTVDHRDSILLDDERLEGKTMMVCCSRAKTSKLVLDL